MSDRERWGTRFGLILAMAGNAVGLGNFLRFPVQAAQNGGGAFMIPYFIAFILLAVPLMWIEWTIGRRGGRFGHGSFPGMLDSMWKHPIAKYLGVAGLFVSTIIFMYYTYIESWSLGFSVFTLLREYFGMESFGAMKGFLESYQGSGNGHFDSVATAYVFLIISMGANFFILSKGISGGIEKFARIAMPTLLIFAIFLVIWVFTVGTPDPVNHPERSVWSGFAFIWNPNFSALGDSKIWLAAAGQVFFTLSVGMTTLHTYASYLKPKEDIALSGLATASINEFSEVILGGSIAIPIAVAFFGIAQTQAVAEGGAYDLGFVSMAMIFQQIPVGNIIGFLWFFLLFFAGITSSVAMAQPFLSFLKEQFKFSHKKATFTTFILTFVCVNLIVFFHQYGFLDELDYWAGTFGLVIVALIESIIFGWLFGIDKAWKELNRGSDIKVPQFFKFVIKYVTPIYILFVLIFWTIQDAIPTLLFQQTGADGSLLVTAEDVPFRIIARVMMVGFIVAFIVMVRKAWRRNKFNYDEPEFD